MKILSILACCIAWLTGCSPQSEKVIVNPDDYNAFLKQTTNTDITSCNTELAFWQGKLKEVPESETYRSRIASLFAARFMLNGRVEDMNTSDSLYRLVASETTQPSAALFRSMAANCITQHKFREAYQYVQQALTIGEGRASSLLMLVDVDMELGDYKDARLALSRLDHKNFFPYLILKAKIKDHEGDLDSAIVLMELAFEKIKDNPSLSLWTKSNLADMYGHAGRVKEAYVNYMSILKQNPDYDYALKGIAWIAYSHDHNNAEAKRIIRHIMDKRETPDMHLLLAKIASTEGHSNEAQKQLSVFTTSATQAKYGNMYNKYIALLDAEELATPSKTIQIAQIEVRNRPTPQSYDLLAWGYFKNGDSKKALAVARENIEHQTFEPDALYHLGMIYKDNRMEDEARDFLKQAEQSSFELGPEITKKIRNELKR